MSETFYIAREKGKDGGAVYATEELALAMAEAWTKNTGIETIVYECTSICSLRREDGAQIGNEFGAVYVTYSDE